MSSNNRGKDLRVEPKGRDVQHPDSVKVDEEMNGASLLQIGLEEGFAPVDFVELHEPLSGRDVDQTGLRGRRER
jgi:hypothetical protein